MYIAFLCKYCGQVGRYRFIKNHEKECDLNPSNKTCFTCEHCITDYKEHIICRNLDMPCIAVNVFGISAYNMHCKGHRLGKPSHISKIDGNIVEE